MSIVFVSEYYPPFGAGGAEISLPIHARILAKNGYPTVVITPNYGAKGHEIQDGVEIFRFPFQHRLGGVGKQVAWDTFLRPGFHFQLSREIRRILAGKKVRCLHNNNSSTVIGTGMAAEALGVPHVAYIRDMANVCATGAVCLMEKNTLAPPTSCSVLRNCSCYLNKSVPTYAPNSTWVKRGKDLASLSASYADIQWRYRYYKKAKRITFCSVATQKLHEKLSHFSDPSRHRVLHDPLDTSVSPESETPARIRELKSKGAQILLYVGKVSKGKGCDVLFEAHRKVLEKAPNTWLVVVGNTNPKDWNFAQERVHFAGFVPQDQLRAYFEACDLVVVPSTWPEPFGRANLDAGKYGKPTVATKVGGIPEVIVDGKTGILVDRLDPAALASAISDLLLDTKKREKLGDQAREHVKRRFGEATVLKELEMVYDGL